MTKTELLVMLSNIRIRAFDSAEAIDDTVERLNSLIDDLIKETS